MSSPIRRSLPLRGQSETERPSGPKPFSREWLSLPPEQQSPPSRRRGGLPGWLPSERSLTVAVVALLVLTSTIISTGWAPSVAGSTSGGGRDNPRVGAGHIIDPTSTSTPSVVAPAVATGTAGTQGQPVATETTPPDNGGGPTAGDATKPAGEISLDGAGGGADPNATEPDATAADATEADAATPSATEGDSGTTAETAATDGAILPKYRILSYYGHPNAETMGILGQFDKDELLAQLLDEAATYDAADPNRPIKPAFEVIASVAQHDPMSDGSYLGYTDHDTIMEYLNFTAEHDILLILDLQIGHTSVKEDMAKVEEYLRYPNVHLAIDPEFSLKGDEIPSEVIGGVDGKDVTYAQNRLVKICREEGIPPKVLIVHRFRHEMIRHDERVKPVAGVQLVIDMDGFGNPSLKMDSYKIFITDKKPEYAGIKLFYDQDEPLMSAADVLALGPPPDYVMYQ